MAYTITPELKRIYHLNYVSRPGVSEKLRARAQCAYAIRSGKLIRQPCAACGNPKSEAHHDDYSKPLNVEWLCRQCHAAAHRKSHCVNGHALTDDNICLTSGKRQCLRCRNHRRTLKTRT